MLVCWCADVLVCWCADFDADAGADADADGPPAVLPLQLLLPHQVPTAGLHALVHRWTELDWRLNPSNSGQASRRQLPLEQEN